MGRVRKWESEVGSKIDWTRRDVFQLRDELASKIAEMSDFKISLAEGQKRSGGDKETFVIIFKI